MGAVPDGNAIVGRKRGMNLVFPATGAHRSRE
jgi:hypothetical protein